MNNKHFDSSNDSEVPDWQFDSNMNHEFMHGWQDIGSLFAAIDRPTAGLLPNSDLLRAALGLPVEGNGEDPSVEMHNQNEYIYPELLATYTICQPISFAGQSSGYASFEQPPSIDDQVPPTRHATFRSSPTPPMGTRMPVNNEAAPEIFQSSAPFQHIPHWYNLEPDMSAPPAVGSEATHELNPQYAIAWSTTQPYATTPTLLANLNPVTTAIGVVMAGNNKEHIVITISNRFSDGNAQTVLPSSYVAVDGTELYRRSLAKAWMEDQGHAVAGERYILDVLPDHYITARNPSQPEDRHMYLFGHPSGKRYSSARAFFVHFKHLKLYGTNHGCECGNCQKSKA